MAGAVNSQVPIAAPLPAPSRLGLLASAQRPDGLPREWINGVTFDPETCRGDDDAWWDCPPEGGDGPNAKATDSVRSSIITYIPWVAVEHDTCSAMGWREADYEARARRTLEASQGRKMEAELWSGGYTIAAGTNNAYLTNAILCADLGTAPLVYGLAELQEYLANTIDGRGMIHCTLRTATLWQSAGVVRREGALLLDLYDNIVVAGAGYDGSGPGNVAPPASGDTAWAYATGMVQVALDGVVITPGDLSEALDRSTNTVTYHAERYVGAWWDGCAHAGIEIDLCSPCCEPTSS